MLRYLVFYIWFFTHFYLSYADEFDVNVETDIIYSPQVARRGQFPYQVGFKYDKTQDRFAGALISNMHVLTVADRIVRGRTLTVYLGAHIFEDTNEPGRIRQLVNTDTDVAIHPEYDPDLRPLDNLAIVYLVSPVATSDWIAPIALPVAKETWETFDDDVVSIAGWGTKRPYHLMSQALNFINVTVYPYELCAKQKTLEGVQLCLDTSSGRLLCDGDDGTGIATMRDAAPLLIGIANVPERCVRTEKQVAIRLSAYIDWIDDMIHMS